MTTITRERLLKIQQWRETYGPGSNVVLPTEEAEELARIALASLDAGSDSNNHPAHGPLSDYRLHRIREILGKAAAQSDGGNIGYAMSDAVKAIDELLAGRKAEPMAWLWTNEQLDKQSVSLTDPADEENTQDAMACGWKHQPLYTAQPAPVVPDRFMFEIWWESENGTPLDSWDSLRTTDGYCDDGIDGQFDAWNACRAAMLNGGKS